MLPRDKRKAHRKTSGKAIFFALLLLAALFVVLSPVDIEDMPSKHKVKTTETTTPKRNKIKTIYLIRHGESQGQTAKKNGLDRKRDNSLIDCGLSKKGIQQASDIPSYAPPESVELVVSSPLTRALQTAVLGFPHKPILVNYGLREIGSSLPENLPRGDIDQVIQYIQEKHNLNPSVDGESLKPENWPQQETHYSYNRTARIQQIFRLMARERPEETIAVVCHYGVISAALAGFEARPRNGVPIPCHLHPDGRLVPIS